MKFIIQGFILGLAYVAPIGMQNIYVINNAISNSKKRAFTVALITILFDISLALACFFGMGAIMERFQILKLIILFIGSIAVVYIGINLIRSKAEANVQVDINKSIPEIFGTCLLVTWANPQAIIDGSLLLGGFKASLPPGSSTLFILGLCMASAAWFLGLATIISKFKNSFNTKVIRIINIVCGVIVVYFGLKLGYSFINNIKNF
jgi:L-lysine exporter family protein LysE/ArgO